MTRSLRQKHRFVSLGLVCFLPCVFVFSLGLRKPPSYSADDLEIVAKSPDDYGPIEWTSAELWPSTKILTKLRRNTNGAVAVELQWHKFNKPDLLLYWVGEKSAVAGELPPNARFLGRAQSNAPLPIPDELRGITGTLILYSLADSEVIAASRGFIIQKR